MDPITLALVGAGVSGAISIISELIAQGQEDKAREYMQKATDLFGPDFAPHFSRVTAGQVTSAAGDLTDDNASKAAQSRILQGMEDEYASGGMTPADQAAMNLARNQAAASASSMNAGIQQNLAARGQSSGLMNAYLQQGAAQDASNQMANMGMQAQVAARDRALHALESGGALAGQMRGQSNQFGLARANALDDVNKFNAGLSYDAAKYNSGLEQSEYNAGFDERQQRAQGYGNQATGEYRRADGTRRVGAAASNAASSASSTAAKYKKG